MRKIIYLICVLTSVCILSGCGSKSITIKFGGDTEAVVESKDESETEEGSVKLEESKIDEMSAVQRLRSQHLCRRLSLKLQLLLRLRF